MRFRQWFIAAAVFMFAGTAISLSLTGQDVPSPSIPRLPEADAEAWRVIMETPTATPEELDELSAEQLQSRCRKAKQERVTSLRAHVVGLKLAFDLGGADLRGIGRVDVRMLANAVAELALAEADIATTRAERVSAIERRYNVVRQVEEILRAQTEAGTAGGGTAALSLAVANRLSAEVALVSELAVKDVPLKP